MKAEEQSDVEANDSVTRRGIFDCDEAYKTPTSEDYLHLFETGIIVLDTNVLINLYRSNERTRSDTFAVLRQLQERLWIPHQVISEFWRIRDLPSVKGHHRAKARTASTALDKALRSLTDTTDRWLKDVHLDGDDSAKEEIKGYRDRIDAELAGLKRYIQRQAENDALEGTDSTHTDPVLLELDPLFFGRIGPPLTPESYVEASIEAKRRADEEIPPGYADYGSKTDERASGDYMIWRQVMTEAARVRSNVLLITGDVKDDWWTPRTGENLARPRAELRKEMRDEAGVELFMMTPSQLLAEAARVFALKVDERSVSDLASREGDVEVDAFPDYLREAIVKGLKAAHSRALAAHRTGGHNDRSPYSLIMAEAALKELTARFADIGGSVLDAHGMRYPIFDEFVFVPLKTSSGREAIRTLSSYRLKRLGSAVNASQEISNFPDGPLGGLRPIVIEYVSDPDVGIESIQGALGRFTNGGEFKVSFRFDLL
ncbi:PIN-like domain-containing protein [Streptomyces californicus]|uniref:PIN-like domain-containing protein n=1 Tax=Streptomyces californicus TaxID=67351 RepID=UPI0033C2BF77